MSWRPGKRLGPYEIVAPLGAGGMGEVYRARDTRLGREVAVKVLPAKFASDPERLRRFEQEARATAALDHPSILAVFDIGTHEGTPYIVEQLLEGESLRERLRGGPLPPPKAVEFGIQIAQGLAAAHEKGIVHRDLKPGNLFVTKDGRIKILDFGLARLSQPECSGAEALSQAPTADQPTREGKVLGTPGYMAPEQVRGYQADARSDLFAFGCVLYEMLSGRRAFGGATGTDVAAAILKEDPPDLLTAAPKAPPVLAQLVRRCLEKRPEDRFSSARDIAFALDALSGSAPTATGAPLAWIIHGGPGRYGMRLLLGLVTVVLILGAGTWLTWRQAGKNGKKGPDPDPHRVAVAIFENETGDPSLDTLGRMASDWTTEALSRLGPVQVVPTSLIFELARARPQTKEVQDPVRALAEATGAGMVVSGTIYAQGKILQIQAKITTFGTDKAPYLVESATGPRDKPMEALDTVRRRVLNAIAARQPYLFNLKAEEEKPPDYEAYKELLIGEESYGADYTAAMAHFRHSVELDPDFVTPRFLLVAAAWNTGDFAEAERQMDLIDKKRTALTPSQRRRADAWRASLAGRWEEALTARREIARLNGGSPADTYVLAAYLLLTNHLAESIQVADQPVHWELMLARSYPFGESYFQVLCGSLHLLGQHERELAEARRGETIYPDHPVCRSLEADALIGLGRLEEAGKVVEAGLGTSSSMGNPGIVLWDAAVEMRAHGHRDESLRMAGRAVEWLKHRPEEEAKSEETRWMLGQCLYRAERWQEARAVFAEATKQHPEEIAYKGMLGILAARLGDRAEAQRVAEELRKMDRPHLFGVHTYYRARIAALLGERTEAVNLLREAISQGLDQADGVTYQDGYPLALHRDMDLESLHGFTPFEVLQKPKEG